MRKRILALFLAIILAIGMIPITGISYADEDEQPGEQPGGGFIGIGDTAGQGGGNAPGRWTKACSGYRIYAINKSGDRITPIQDFLFRDDGYGRHFFLWR